VVNDSDLVAISDKLRLVSVNDSEPEPSAADLLKSDEELARLLQVSVFHLRICVQYNRFWKWSEFLYLFLVSTLFLFSLCVCVCACIIISVQAEEEALMLQQYVASQNPQEFDSRVRPYVSQVLMVFFSLLTYKQFYLCFDF